VLLLAGLFGFDSFAGGFIVQSFIVFWFAERYGASTALMGVVLAATGVIQAASFVVAPRIAARWGLLNTMVFTHLPSNVLLALIPLAPSLGVALALLLLRFPLSQMDVPTRQAYLAALAGPDERAAAASVTNAARTVARPFAAPLAGAATGSAVSGLPFFIAGALKAVYDLTFFFLFRHVPIGEPATGSAPVESNDP
jgi:predicted MFS family arabinose efflux permease